MKVRILITVTLCVSLLRSIGASAQLQRETPEHPTFANNQYSIDIAGRGLFYRETNTNGTNLDTELGGQPGLETSLGFQRDWGIPNLYVLGQFRGTFGTLTHGEANPAFNGMPTAGNIRDIQFRFGKAFRLGSHAQIVPYFGYGRRSWVRDTSANSGGYYEQYDHNTAGAGAMIQSGRRTVFSAYGFAGKTFGTHLAARAIPVNYSCFIFYGCFASNPSALDFTLTSKPAVMAGVSWDFDLSTHWRMNLGFDVNHFGYGQSAFQAGFHEPDSTTTEAVAKFGLGYAF